MTKKVEHRGPDDHGIWLDSTSGVALGHQRLAVVDLSHAGHQPMQSQSGRFVLVFNGEIYNHQEIRQQLPNLNWRGHSDTETLLAAVEEWGIERALKASVGMFALALWDKKQRSLLLARDRIGEKPLYYGWQGKSFLFGSELSPLTIHPDFERSICRKALALFVRRGFVPAPFSIFKGLHKLQPGAIAVLPMEAVPNQAPVISYYWQLKDIAERQASTRFDGSPSEAVTNIEIQIERSIRDQCVADVPVGAFLSGGIDSSTVAAVMQSKINLPVRTFSIGFAEQGYDESTYARKVADFLNTEHTELHVSGNDALSVIPELPRIYDEPFADASQIPSVLLSRLTREHVTVSLSGDGGDELFCGYGRYSQIVNRWRYLQKMPLPARRIAARLLPGGRVKDGLGSSNIDLFYDFSIRQWKGFPNLVLGSSTSHSILPVIPQVLSNPIERMMYTDTMDYLPNDILTKVDRAAMSCSLETRMPFLDHRLVEFIWSLPQVLKVRQNSLKWPLRQVLRKYVPSELVERPKMGFGVPLEHWLRGPLRDWAESLLNRSRIEREGYFDASIVRQEWECHISGKRDRHYGLWSILMFQAWLELSKQVGCDGHD